MPYLLYLIIRQINNLLKEEVLCQRIKLHRKQSTMRKYLNSLASLINSKEIQTTPETRNIETQTDIIYQEKSIRCNIQTEMKYPLQKCTLVKMKWVHTQMKVTTNELMTYDDVLYESDSSSSSDFDSNDNKDNTKKRGIHCFLVVSDNSFWKMFYLFW